MTIRFRTSVIATAVALALPAALHAQTTGQSPAGKEQANRTHQPSQQQQSQQRQGQQAQINLSQLRVSQLKNMDVVDARGQDIGEISEVVVDMQSGRIHAAVVEFGGFMGVGDKQYAFPVSRLNQGKQANQLVLDVDKQKLEDAEGFARNQWPAMGDDYWGRVGGGQAASGGSKKGQEKQAQQGKRNLVRASEFIGRDVQDKSGQDVGDVQDLVLDVRKGRVSNVVIDVDGAGQAMVQPKQLSGGTGDKLVIGTNAEQLKKQARPARDRSAAGGASGIPPGNGDVGVLGPTRAGQDPVGAAQTKPHPQAGGTTRSEGK